MADDNNARASAMPAEPHPALRVLDRLVGTWEISGDTLTGRSRYRWMEGGFFLVHEFDLQSSGRPFSGVEYAFYDEETGRIRTRLFDSAGSRFVYTWAVEGDEVRIWFGDEGSDNFYVGTISADGNRRVGTWQWPDGRGGTGGYSATATRITPA